MNTRPQLVFEICPYCKDRIDNEFSRCSKCGASYHRECLTDHKCVVFGCEGEATIATPIVNATKEDFVRLRMEIADRLNNIVNRLHNLERKQDDHEQNLKILRFILVGALIVAWIITFVLVLSD